MTLRTCPLAKALLRLTELRLGHDKFKDNPVKLRERCPQDVHAVGDLSGFPALCEMSIECSGRAVPFRAGCRAARKPCKPLLLQCTSRASVSASGAPNLPCAPAPGLGQRA